MIHRYKRSVLRTLLAAAVATTGTALAQPAPAAELTADDFRPISEHGFGDPANSYAWSMAYFKDKLYVGTNHNFLCVIQSGVTSPGRGDNPRLPGDCPERLIDADLRGRIFTYDPQTNTIETVFVSPTIKILQSDGTRVDLARDAGYRTMQVFTEPDGTEALYVGTFSTTNVPQPPARILRTVDGIHYEEVPINVPGREQYRSFRSLAVFKNRLYVIGFTKDGGTPVLLEAVDPATGDFRQVSEPGFGDPVNLGAFELAVFKGYLYVGTFVSTEGFQLLKTQAAGSPPYNFTPVLLEGAYRGLKNQSVLSLMPFKDHLYVGSGIFFGSFALLDDFDPAASELLRVKPNDTWEIVVGEARDTPLGRKEPISGLPAGFGNPFIGYLWRMAEHNGVLYAGTLDTSVLAQYAQDITIDDVAGAGDLGQFPHLIDLIAMLGPDEIADVISAVEGGFDLWSTTDGIQWNRITRTGLGDEFAYGVRTMKSTPLGLFLGTANPFFGCQLYLAQPPGQDSDGDSFPDAEDNCPLTWNLDQLDLDQDGIGNACDPDTDGDCIPNAEDAAPLAARTGLTDTDGDGIPDGCDEDSDGDTILDTHDNCPLVPNFDQADADGNGMGDACEPGIADNDDPPGNPSDRDGTSNDADEPGATRPAGSLFCGNGVVGAISPMLLGLMILGLSRRR